MLPLPPFAQTRVVVAGDLMLDRYWHGETRRISPEAPVPVVQVDRIEDRPGGAANVALGVAALGAECALISAIGADAEGAELARRLYAAGVHCDLLTLPEWRTPTKVRVVSGQQQLVRGDFESPLPADAAKALAERLATQLAHADLLLLVDYDKGALGDCQAWIQSARKAGLPVVADPKFKPFSAYAGVSLLKPNWQEFLAAWRHQAGPDMTADDMALVGRAETATGEARTGGLSQAADNARDLCERCGIEAMLVTAGHRGMILADGRETHHLPAYPTEVFDVTGAGDTAAAVLAAALAAGASRLTAARLANLAAALAVSRFGAATVSAAELALAQADAEDQGIVTPSQLEQLVAAARNAGERIVFTNGCFDILHAGHVHCLNQARTLGDRLIVAVNDDASTARLKGPGRPINSLPRRQQVLAGLAAVDWVTHFPEDTPETLLDRLRPDVLAKGGDYRPDQVVGADLVRGYGGEIRVLDRVADLSTTAILAGQGYLRRG